MLALLHVLRSGWNTLASLGRFGVSCFPKVVGKAQLQRALRPEGLQQLVKKKQKEYELAWQAVDGVAAVM
eukprot:5790989-Amphidinium_carterae.1